MIILKSVKFHFARTVNLFLAILVTATFVPQILNIKIASADDGGYPWVDATALDVSQYDWGYHPCPSSNSTCANYPSLNYNLNGTTYGMADPWKYYLRNCTSYVAWKINQVFNVDISGWGDAKDWDGSATGTGHPYTNDSTPQVGDIAQWGSEVGGGHGHVAYVYAVNNGIASLDEYNSGLPRDASGNLQWGMFYSGRTTASNSAGTPDHYIHIDTIAPPPPPTPTVPTHQDLAWYDGTNLYGFQAYGYGTATAQSGYSTPGWAGAGQYGSDTKEGIFWYDPNTTSIYYIHSGFGSSQLVRGPGVGAPTWAAVGNFTGDGKRDSIAWYSGGVLYTFTGSGLGTTGTATGYSAPTWAGVGDYNHDGKDDLFWYLGGSTQTIYWMSSNGTAVGTNGAASIRGGIGAPVWAGVGDFSGDHYRDALAWYDGTTLWTFEGSSLGTTGSVTGYSTPTWAGVGQWNSSDTKDKLFWYLGSTGTIYGIDDNGSSFTGVTTLRGPGIGAPVWADTGNFY